MTRYNQQQQSYLENEEHQARTSRLSPIKSNSHMESTLSKIMKENGHSNSNPLIALIGDTYSTDQ